MDVVEAIRTRRSIRKFKQCALDSNQVQAFKDAVRWAPSAHNLESRKFYFVFDQTKVKDLCAVTLNKFEPVMPLVVVACADCRRTGSLDKYAIMDVAASVENLLLAVHGLGLGAVWVGAFDAGEARKILKIPDGFEPLVLVPIGMPTDPRRAGSRKRKRWKSPDGEKNGSNA